MLRYAAVCWLLSTWTANKSYDTRKSVVSPSACPEPSSADRVWRGSAAAKCTATMSEFTLAPVRARTHFKLATLAFQSRATGQPDHLAVQLRSHKPRRCLRSSSQELLTVPNCKTMLGSRRFSVAAPRVWNCLPLDLKTDCNSLRGVKSSLSTYLLRRDCI